MNQLIKVDLKIHSIPYLTNDDLCFYFLNYTEDGYIISPHNSMIFNFKKDLKYKNTGAWWYRNQAIQQFALMLHNIFYKIANRITIIPMPTSTPKDSPDFNDRLLKTMEHLQYFGNGCYHIENCLDTLITQIPSHSGGNRNPNDLYDQIIFTKLLQPLKEYVFLIDDVLTTGGHFKACQKKILHSYPNAKICGIFLAKTDHRYV